VIVTEVVREQSLRMPLIERDDVIEQVAPTGLNPSLCHSILPGAFKRSAYRANTERADGERDLEAEVQIIIEDYEFGPCPEWKRFPQLLSDPRACRMAGDIDVQDLPPVVTDHEEAVEQPKCDSWKGEEIHCGDSFRVIPQERNLALRRFGISRCSPHQRGSAASVTGDLPLTAGRGKCRHITFPLTELIGGISDPFAVGRNLSIARIGFCGKEGSDSATRSGCG
jgi:hypothetical protein